MSDDVRTYAFRCGLRGSFTTGADDEEPMVYTADGSPYRAPPPAPVYGPREQSSWERRAYDYSTAPRLVLETETGRDSRLVIVERTGDDGETYYRIGDESPDQSDGLWRQEPEQGVVMTEEQLRAALAWIEQQKAAARRTMPEGDAQERGESFETHGDRHEALHFADAGWPTEDQIWISSMPDRVIIGTRDHGAIMVTVESAAVLARSMMVASGKRERDDA